MKYTFIVNPHAHSGLGQTLWNRIEPILKNRSIDYQAHFTSYQGHATRLVRSLCADGQEHIVVVLGGDGSINEVINGIPDFSTVILGYIPTGSANDFARDLGLPTDPLKALDVILSQELIRPVDIGELHYQNHTRFFAVSAGIGFDAAVCHQAVISKLKVFLNRLKLGKLTYAGIAINRLILTDPEPMDLILDEEPPIHFDRAYFIAIMNRCFEGGGFKFCPQARDDDGLLDIIVAGNMSKLKVLSVLPFAFPGWHTHFKGIHLYRCSAVSIHSAKALPVHADGEPVFLQHDMTSVCSKAKLRIICTNTVQNKIEV